MEVTRRPLSTVEHYMATTGSPSGGGGGGSGSSTSSFIDEISAEFLVCRICSEGLKRPKTLRCLHTFCEECLEIRYAIEEQERPYRFLLSRSLSCPLCLVKTDLPPGGVRRLPDNAVLTQLDDVIRRRKLSAGAQSCDVCSAVTSSSSRGSTSRATTKCLECSKVMCARCVGIHRKTKVTKDHCLFDIHVEKDVECKVHREEAVRFYCDECQSCICVLCTFQDHSGHSIFSFAEGIARHSSEVRSLIVEARSRSQRLSAQLAALRRCEASLRATDEAIRSTAIEMVSGVRRREREMLAELRGIYDGGPDRLSSQRKNLTEVVRTISSTCDLAEVLLDERNAEFLLVHREISDRLNAILKSPLKDLPDELVNRNVRFRAASKRNAVDPLGWIHVTNCVTGDASEEEEVEIRSEDRPNPGHPSPLLSTDDGCVDDIARGPASVCQLNLECVCDRKQQPAQTTSSQPPDVLTSFYLDRPEVMLRGRQVLRPPSPRGPDLLWPLPLLRRQRELWDSETEPPEQTVALVTETKSTSTVCISTVDRSTLTTQRTTNDRSTTTDWLVMSRDQETFTSAPPLLNGSTQTDVGRVSSKCVQAHPETLNRLTQTRRPIHLERETNTPSVARFDCEVTAKIIGDDKATSTTSVQTSDAAVTCDLVDPDLDLELDLEGEIDRNLILRHGQRRSCWKRSLDPTQSSSSSFSASSSSVSLSSSSGLMERRTEVRSSVARGRRSIDEDDGYESRLKPISSEDEAGGGRGGSNLERQLELSPIDPSDGELVVELEKYRNRFEESSSTTGEGVGVGGGGSSQWMRCSFSTSSSTPSISSSSSLLLSSSSSQRVSPSSLSISDDLLSYSSAAESAQRCAQLIDQSAESLPRTNPTEELLPSAFAEELSTLEENDDEEELEDLVERNNGSMQHFGGSRRRPTDRKPEDLLSGVFKDRASSASASVRGRGFTDQTDRELSAHRHLRLPVSAAVQANDVRDGNEMRSSGIASIKGGSDERGSSEDTRSQQMIQDDQSTDDVIGSYVESNDSRTPQTTTDSRDHSMKPEDGWRCSDLPSQPLCSRCLDLDGRSIDGKGGVDVAAAPGADFVRTEESNTPHDRPTDDVSVGRESGEISFSRPSVISPDDDDPINDQWSDFTAEETPDEDRQSKPDEGSNDTNTAVTYQAIATEEKIHATQSAAAANVYPDKFDPSPPTRPSLERADRRGSSRAQETELEPTPTGANTSDGVKREAAELKPDLISEKTPIIPTGTTKERSASAAVSSAPGVIHVKNAYTRLERLLPELRLLAPSLANSSHSSLVQLLFDICSVLVKDGRPDKDQRRSTQPPIEFLVDRAASPIRPPPTIDRQTSTRVVTLATQGSNTEPVNRVDIGVQSRRSSASSSSSATTCDRETSTQSTMVVDKETSTPHVHLLHKKTSTDNQTTVDNQTTMTSDVKAAYLEATRRPTLTFSRGTCTPPTTMSCVDRAASPVRFSCVDKAVLATKGDALEPVDTFPGVGKTKAKKPFVSSRKARLECISEGAIEEEEEEETIDSNSDRVDPFPPTLSSFRLKMVQRLTTTTTASTASVHQKQLPCRSFAKSSLLPVSPRPRKTFESTAFSFDAVDSKEMMEELEETFEVS